MSVCIVGCACVLKCHQSVSWGRYSGEMDTAIGVRFCPFLTPCPFSSTASARRESSRARVAASHGSER